MGYLRRLYQWVLHWSETPYGLWALFVLAFAESSFFPVPPDVLLIALVLGASASAQHHSPSPPSLTEEESFFGGLRQWLNYFARFAPRVCAHSATLVKTFPKSRSSYIALVCAVGSLIGGIAGYGIGHFLWYDPDSSFSSIAQFFFSSVPGFTEAAFFAMQDLYTAWDFWIIFTAGFTPIPYKLITITAGVFDINFLLFCVASIISRSARFFLVAFLIWLFGPPVKAFIDHYFNLLCIAFLALLIGGFMIIKVLI